jgi:7-cyano-7-deazaguanine synthase
VDSTLVGVLAREEGIDTYPLFIDYGQRAAKREWEACRRLHETFGLRPPVRMDLSGFGSVIRSGLTTLELDVARDAFTPGRNLMFLLMGAAYAFQIGAVGVTIGLLSEKHSLFPDQRAEFLELAEHAIAAATARRIRIVVPLFEFSKADVLELARQKGIGGTYSCHDGAEVPCGACISCLEVRGTIA